MRLFKSPQKFWEETVSGRKKVFLAGSIEMGVAENWQDAIIKHFATYDIDILSPRRDNWDNSWEQSAHNAMFKEQVEWELRGLEEADFVIMYFVANTKSPISLSEFGLYARSGKMAVFCPSDFWKKGNVDIVCQRYGVPCFEDEEKFIAYIKEKI